MTEKEFLHLYSQYYGERVDNLDQIVSSTFSGEELFEFCKYLEDNKKDGQ